MYNGWETLLEKEAHYKDIIAKAKQRSKGVYKEQIAEWETRLKNTQYKISCLLEQSDPMIAIFEQSIQKSCTTEALRDRLNDLNQLFDDRYAFYHKLRGAIMIKQSFLYDKATRHNNR